MPSHLGGVFSSYLERDDLEDGLEDGLNDILEDTLDDDLEDALDDNGIYILNKYFSRRYLFNILLKFKFLLMK